MMKGRWCKVLLCVLAVSLSWGVRGQSIHFSQYFNAPLLVNPANTALSPDYDYRIGANYRNQWAVLPVPFNTSSAFADVKIGSGGDKETKNWLGLGGVIFNDRSGNGELSLLQMQGAIAYHLHLSRKMMLSFGGSGALVQRAVNLDKLTFDAQWDGYNFNTRRSNGEKLGTLKASYTTVNAGLNLAFFPNEAVYTKLGVGLANINEPIETFYNSTTNKVNMRPTINLDMLFKTNEQLIINPSVYFGMQGGASELVFGSLFRRNMSSERYAKASELIVGLYHRLGDAVIGVAGYQYSGWQLVANYDFTISTLGPYNAGYGALEISLITGGSFNKGYNSRAMYTCPRFN